MHTIDLRPGDVMKRKIYKYQVHSLRSGRQISIPEGADILSAGIQGGKIFIWAAVPTPIGNRALRHRRVCYVETGQMLPEEPAQFIGTIIAGIYVWHVIEVLP